jgi:glycosyltransferase involved in cell wall biosynthesis
MRLYKVPDWKCDVVPNGVVPTEYQKEVDPEEVKRSYGLNPSSPLILYTGRLEYQKGPDLLLEAISQVYNYHGDVQAIIAGAGCMQQYLQERAKDLPVKFVGYIPDTEYIRLLNACDLAVIPSRNEPFGLVLLEAWSANRCVIASNVGGLSENIDTFVNGLKVRVNPDSLAWGISTTLDEPSGSAAMGKEGRRKVDQMFLWEPIAQQMTGTYSRAVA